MTFRLRCLTEPQAQRTRHALSPPAATATVATSATPAAIDAPAVADVAVAAGGVSRDVAAETARREVLAELRAHPGITRAAVTRWEGDTLLVTLAVRDIGTCELAIPGARVRTAQDYGALLDLLTAPPEARA